jgi:hypothetical protein
MTTVKSLAIIALLIGGASLAVAQNGPATGGQPPIAGGAAGNSATPGPSLQKATPSHHATRHHKRMYMSAKGSHHKGTLKDNSRLQTTPSSKQ